MTVPMRWRTRRAVDGLACQSGCSVSTTSTLVTSPTGRWPPGTDQLGTVQAISPETGELMWTYEQRAATTSLVATAGGLVFGGDLNGRFRALDAETGDVLWKVNLGSPITGFPITFAVDGRQYVAVSTGSSRSLVYFAPLTPEHGQQPVRFRLARLAHGRHRGEGRDRDAAASPYPLGRGRRER